MNEQASAEPRHPIRVVTARTGLSAHAVRAWELRYGAVKPSRSTGGHRLYSDDDIQRLRLLHSLTEGGRRIGQVARLQTSELAALLREDRAEERAAPGAQQPRRPDERTDAIVDEAFKAVVGYDDQALDATIRRAALDMSASAVIDGVIAPLLERIGTAWVRGQLRPAQEHMATAVVERALDWIVDSSAAPAGAPRLVVTTPTGEYHSLGAQLAAASAATIGWDVMYLGPDLPAEDVVLAASATGARAVALSLVHPSDEETVHSYLRDLAAGLPMSVALLVGGPAAAGYADTLAEVGAVRVTDYEQLRSALADLEVPTV